MMRRMMYRLAERLSEKRKCLAIVNGECIGQVASQTLESMGTINQVVSIPVIRPCVCYDKLEIIDLAKKIGSYDTSILPFEDCCTIFTPKNPVTKPTIKKAEMWERKFDFEPLLEQTLEKVETLYIVPNQHKQEDDIF